MSTIQIPASTFLGSRVILLQCPVGMHESGGILSPFPKLSTKECFRICLIDTQTKG